MRPLNDKQAAFVREYLVDLNATQAAIRAGYSLKSAGQIGDENLKKPQIAEAVAKGQERLAKKTEISQERVLRELARLGFADLRRASTWDGEKIVSIVASDDLDDDTAAAISEVSQSEKGGLKIKLHDKKGALELIGRHLGMFKDRMTHEGPDGGPVKVHVEGELTMTPSEAYRKMRDG